MSKLKIKISPGGKTETTVEGAPGKNCKVVSGPYLAAFAGQTVSDTPTAEASMPEVTNTVNETEQERR